MVARGHDVFVVAPIIEKTALERDRRLIATRRWDVSRVDCSQGTRRVVRGMVRRLLPYLPNSVGARFGYVYGYHLTVERIVAARPEVVLAQAVPAGLAGAEAARVLSVPLILDCEDVLSEMDGEDPSLARWMEDYGIARASRVLATSRSMAAFLESRYARKFDVVYNAFDPCTGKKSRAGTRHAEGASPTRKLRIVWVGQTIGVGRGIEQAADACWKHGCNVELHLIGRVGDEFKARLDAINPTITYHPLVDHDGLVGVLSDFDVGLAIEPGHRQNYDWTITNKAFLYLSAGLAVIASDTEGNRELMLDREGAGVYVARALGNDLERGISLVLERGIGEIRSNAARMLGTWSWSAMQSAYCDLVETTSGRSRAGHRVGNP